MTDNKQFVNIIAAFKWPADEYEIRVLCDEPGFDFAVIDLRKKSCATIGTLRADMKRWLLNGKDEPFKIQISSSSFVDLEKVSVPEEKYYYISYGSVHHIDER